MIPLKQIDEQTFRDADTLREALAMRPQQEHEVPMRRLSVGTDGLLRTRHFEGPLSPAGLRGVLRVLRIPQPFAMDVCPRNLLASNVNTLAKDSELVVRIHSVDGVARGIYPRDRVLMRHTVLVDWLDFGQMNVEATIGDDRLRILAVHPSTREVQAGDEFGCGWELINGEDGWIDTATWRFAKRLICSNGMVEFDRSPLFFRSAESHRPLLQDLDNLSGVLDERSAVLDLKPALTWAAQQPLGGDRQYVVNYLSRRLDGPATKLALDDMTSSETWYDLLNRVTSLARTHELAARRRYEVEGGALLRWFLGQGRRRPPWQPRMCEECEVVTDDGR